MKYTHVFTTKSLKTTAYGLKTAGMDLDELGYDVEVELKHSPLNTELYTTLCLTPKDDVTVGWTNSGYNFWKSVLGDLIHLRETQENVKKADSAHTRAQNTLKGGLARVPTKPIAMPTVQNTEPADNKEPATAGV